jgi:hypothetical protein
MQRGIVVPILGVTIAAWLGGCTADSGDGGILVLKNVHADAMCATTGSETQPGINQGRLDLLVDSPYIYIAQMKSRIAALAGQEDQRTIIVSGADVDVEFPGSSLFSEAELAELDALALTRRRVPFSAAIRPNGVTDAGFDLIPSDLTARIGDKLGNSPTQIVAVATFTIVGDMSGQRVTSQAFSFPITMGKGVVMSVLGACPLSRESVGTLRTGYACNVAQDDGVDCCATATGIRCPATLAM